MFSKTVTPSNLCSLLSSKGYAIVDGLFGTSRAMRLRSDIQHLRENNIMFPNATHLHTNQTTSNKPILVEKKNVMEMDVISEVLDVVPNIKALQHDTFLLNALNQFEGIQLKEQRLKVQNNTGGCFPMHVDSDVSIDTRIVSGILYLNPDWKPEHGGELKLYPHPEKPVTIEPIMDRLVLFSSPHMVHRVLPCFSDRYCLTLWFYGNYASYPTLKKPQNEEDILEFLKQRRVRKHLVKLTYADEWAQSIMESHDPSPAREILLQNHWDDVTKLKQYFAPYEKYLPQVSGPVPWI
jgi:Rps23 Pro-64 3,4-dihydroxylase Tpa1-like proline 4-hydroxylase